MAIWIQSLSWTLIYALGQGLFVYTCLWLILKIAPSLTANQKYSLSLSALSVLLFWFIKTWALQYHLLALTSEQAYTTWHYNPGVHIFQRIAVTDSFNIINSTLSSLQFIFPWLTGLYLAGLIFMMARMIAEMTHIYSLKKSGITTPPVEITGQIQKLKTQLGISLPVQLFISAKAQVPMLIGALKPIVLLPITATTNLTAEQLETILMHELAHLRRHDYLINILQTIVETILFFNPFVWMISAIVRREREHACDDLVLQHTAEPLSYASALATVAMQYTNHPSTIIAASGKSTYLLNRIKRIMEAKPTRTGHSQVAAMVLILAIATCTIAWLPPTHKEVKNTTAQVANDTIQAEETQLVNRLINDQQIDEIKGFTVEKKQHDLFINGQKQPETVANKYLSGLTQEYINVQVYPFMDRLQMHPKASFMQVMFPVSFSSPCVKTTEKKPGC